MNMIQRLAVKAFQLQGNSNPSGVSDYSDVPKSYPWDWWQRDMKLEDSFTNTTVEACVATISQTVAMLPVKHFRENKAGGFDEVKKSSVTRVLRKPNPFQTKSAFFVDFVRAMLLRGEGFGAVTRNNRFEINALYPQHRMSPYISPDFHEVYYSPSNNELIDLDMMIPSRDVLHVRMHTTTHPLIGVTPLTAAKLPANTGTSIQGHENRFFHNMSRPSGVVSTDMTLTAEQTRTLRDKFNEQAQSLNTGGIPILTSGLKYQQISMSAVDAEIIKTYQMTKEDIASVYRIPLALLGIMDKATFANVESLMKFWIGSGLGYIIEHLENSLDELFGLPPTERIEFDTDFLLQADFKNRMEGLSKAVQGGILTINEARGRESLEDKEGCDKPMVQMQMVPVGLTGKKMQAEIENLENPPEPVAPDPDPESDPEPEPEEVSAEDSKHFGGVFAAIKGIQ